MPWSGTSFANRHNHSLHGEAAAKAASIANAILKRGAPEGVAIATANRYAQRHRAEGGLVDAALRIAHRQGGGTLPEMPYFERQEARQVTSQPYGLSLGPGGGRSDIRNVSVGSGSYVMPADIVSGLGDGNTLAGAHVWDQILNSMPWGIHPPQRGPHRGPPNPPHDPALMQGITGTQKEAITPTLARGGRGDDEAEVPVVIADGEIALSPEDVLRVGQHYSPQRDLDAYPASHARILRRGHRVLDEFVKLKRGETIAKLQSLKGPVGSKNSSVGHVKTKAA